MGCALNDKAAKIVVVEDDPTFLSFWERFLHDLGVIDCEFFSDPIAANQFLSKTPCRLLISDIIMPSLNGYEMATMARKKNPLCNIVLTTAYGADLSRFDLADPHFHLLHKPYSNIALLKNLIRYLLDGEPTLEEVSEDSFSENEDYPEVMEWKL